jgi:hypothetical protein
MKHMVAHHQVNLGRIIVIAMILKSMYIRFLTILAELFH